MLETIGLGKTYGATLALVDFNIAVQPGEVIGVIGENGAGKSTFMKLLSGVITPTTGQIILDGKAQNFTKPLDAIQAGISMVHQELNLIPTLSVEDNLFLGKELGKTIVNRSQTRLRAVELLQRVGASFSPTTLCGDLSVAEQQLVEIAKAISEKARIVIFDEPTAVLSDIESEKLFELIGNLKAEGIAVLYVSHRLPEILRLCDRLVVLRDGNKVGEADPKDMTVRELADLMVGRPVSDIYPTKSDSTGNEVLAEFCGQTIHKGEILGFGGLIGSGRTELCESMIGLRKPYVPITLNKSCIGYVSEDRKGKGLVTSMSITDNLALANLNEFNNQSKRSNNANHWIESLGIKTKNPDLPMTSLSGGNQQKCSIGKWLATNPQLLILDEPTRGVDVGAKAEIYQLIADLASKGTAIILISSELPELIGLSHRILVFRDQSIVGEIKQESMNEKNIMALAAGVTH
ncbi:MAG: sugar ABC transporter ATP-binding protein [Fimbriimonas sp.]|jgi:ribose transport system ATP-binding protein